MSRHFLNALAGLGLAASMLSGPPAGAAAKPVAVIFPPPTRLCFVTPGSSLGGGGTSWSDPYILQAALADSSCGEIWVKQGVYKPTQTGNPADAGDRTLSFNIRVNVALYGGFAGYEWLRSQRNPLIQPSVLSGDIDDNDTHTTSGIDLTSADIVGSNSYHVVTLAGSGAFPVGSSTRLDGFHVTGGSGDGALPNDRGGGLYCNGFGVDFVGPSDCSPTLANVNFEGNYAALGGGMFNDGRAGGFSSPTLSKVTFQGNGANFGGAMYNAGVSGTSSPSLTDVTFNGNSAITQAGAMYDEGTGGSSNPVLRNVTFTSNSVASGDGGAMYNNASAGEFASSSSPSLVNVTFYNNSALLGTGAGMYNNGSGGVSSPTLTNVTFRWNYASSGRAISNIAGSSGTASPQLSNVILWHDGTDTAGRQVYDSGAGATPSIAFSVVEGGCASITGAICGAGNLSADPLLGVPGDHGGYTQTALLGPGSSAIDAGTNTGCPSSDQRGGIRPLDGNGDGTLTCDIGAVEYLPNHIFADVPVTGKEWMEPWINTFYFDGISTGCGSSPLVYCPENNVTRAEMAVFLLRAIHGLGYAPPAATHVFADMPVAGKEWMEAWVDEFYNEGLTTGCGSSPLIFCPENHVTRAEMSVFILRSTHSIGWAPPATSGIFADLPVVGKEWMESWVDEFYNESITTGCGSAPLIYCPENNVTRAEMAVFIDRAFHLYP